MADRITVKLSREEYDLLKGAFLASWEMGGATDTLSGWVQAALCAHAQRTPQQRASIHATAPSPSDDGKPYRFHPIDPDILEAASRARVDDAPPLKGGMNAWARAAILYAVDQVDHNLRKQGNSLQPLTTQLPPTRQRPVEITLVIPRPLHTRLNAAAAAASQTLPAYILDAASRACDATNS